MQILAVPWIQLPGQQNILIQALFTEVDYSIRVTDLRTIWGEDLSQEEVEARGDESDCPIDAHSNLKELLKHLQDALTVDSDNVSIFLKRYRESLSLSTTEKIGGTALHWDFELVALPYSAVASGLTLSLFSMMAFYQREIKSLLDVVDAKDNVIHQMNEFLRTANLVFKPNRRQKAHNGFDKAEWLVQCRQKAEKDTKTSQDVIDELSLVGREAEFRKDWRAVLGEVSQWKVEFLPQLAERTPTRVTSTSAQKDRKIAARRDPLQYTPHLAKDDTNEQSHEFVSPKAQRVKTKTKIHTKWSSPVPSSSIGRDSEDDDDDEAIDGDLLAATNTNARQQTISSPAQSPTPRQNYRGNDSKSRLLMTEEPPLFKLRDNRESQELEEDIDLGVISQSSPPAEAHESVTASQNRSDGGDDTTDESDEELDLPKTRSSLADSQSVKQSIRALPNVSDQTSIADTQTETERKPRIEEMTASSPQASQQSGQVKSVLGGTPQKGRVLNLISPRKSNTRESIVEEVKPSDTVDRRHVAKEAETLDPEVERRLRAQEKRKQAEELVKQTSPRKRTRKF